MRIVISGALLFYRRKEAFELIKDCGWIPQTTVTKTTDYLVIGHYRNNSIIGEKSNKLRKAEKYIEHGEKIKIIPEEDFYFMLWTTLSA